MTTGSDSRMVLHLHSTYAVEYVKAEDVRRVWPAFDDDDEVGSYVHAVELGIETTYHVCEPFESICEFLAERAPDHYAKMRVTLVEEH